MTQHISSSPVLPGTGLARFLAASHHQQPDATPIWFMRQAGRCLAEYRVLGKRYDILTMAKTPELCTQITLIPVKELGVDAAEVFDATIRAREGMSGSLYVAANKAPTID